MLGNNTLQLRERESLAYRAICIGILLHRFKIEFYNLNHQDSNMSQENQSLLAWANSEGLLKHASEEELSYLYAPFGTWTSDDCAKVIWHAERLGVLLWMLSLLEILPPVDTSLGVEVSKLMDFIPLFSDADELLIKSCVRSELEISSMEDLLTTYAFTLSMEPKDLNKPSDDGTVRQTLRREAEAMLKIGMVPNLISEQLPAFNKGIGDLSKRERFFLKLLLEQRIGALYWATNQIADWSEIKL